MLASAPVNAAGSIDACAPLHSPLVAQVLAAAPDSIGPPFDPRGKGIPAQRAALAKATGAQTCRAMKGAYDSVTSTIAVYPSAAASQAAATNGRAFYQSLSSMGGTVSDETVAGLRSIVLRLKNAHMSTLTISTLKGTTTYTVSAAKQGSLDEGAVKQLVAVMTK